MRINRKKWKLRLARPASIASLPHFDKMRKEDRLDSNKTQPT